MMGGLFIACAAVLAVSLTALIAVVCYVCSVMLLDAINKRRKKND